MNSIIDLYNLFIFITEFPYRKVFNRIWDSCLFIVFMTFLIYYIVINNVSLLFFTSAKSYHCQYGVIINRPNWPSEIICSGPDQTIGLTDHFIINLVIFNLVSSPLVIFILVRLYKSLSLSSDYQWMPNLIAIVVYSPICLLIARYVFPQAFS